MQKESNSHKSTLRDTSTTKSMESLEAENEKLKEEIKRLTELLTLISEQAIIPDDDFDWEEYVADKDDRLDPPFDEYYGDSDWEMYEDEL